MSTIKKIKIAVTEDNRYYNAILSRYLQTVCKGMQNRYPGLNFDIRSYHSGEELLENVEKDLDILLLDYYLSDDPGQDTLNGPEVLAVVRDYCKHCSVIMVSEQNQVVNAVELMKKGLYDYVDKNLSSNNRIGSIIQEIIRKRVAA
ncbi:MAG: response regulator [Flavobacteriales bacterium]|nr:response regulator [Flavobacteriales bacterium]MCB9448896.1 response regulator [Flavobacteriales bacterium]